MQQSNEELGIADCEDVFSASFNSCFPVLDHENIQHTFSPYGSMTFGRVYPQGLRDI